jgi:hypothetical protein
MQYAFQRDLLFDMVAKGTDDAGRTFVNSD